MFELARVAEQYCGGEIRLTVEQNVILPNVAEQDLQALLADPFLQGRFKTDPGTSDSQPATGSQGGREEHGRHADVAVAR